MLFFFLFSSISVKLQKKLQFAPFTHNIHLNYMDLISTVTVKAAIFISYNSTLTRCERKQGERFSRGSDGGDESSPFGEILSEEGDGGEEGEAVAKACKQRGKRGHDSHWPAGLEHCVTRGTVQDQGVR